MSVQRESTLSSMSRTGPARTVPEPRRKLTTIELWPLQASGGNTLSPSGEIVTVQLGRRLSGTTETIDPSGLSALRRLTL